MDIQLCLAKKKKIWEKNTKEIIPNLLYYIITILNILYPCIIIKYINSVSKLKNKCNFFENNPSSLEFSYLQTKSLSSRFNCESEANTSVLQQSHNDAS